MAFFLLIRQWTFFRWTIPGKLYVFTDDPQGIVRKILIRDGRGDDLFKCQFDLLAGPGFVDCRINHKLKVNFADIFQFYAL